MHQQPNNEGSVMIDQFMRHKGKIEPWTEYIDSMSSEAGEDNKDEDK
jgi:hypothetical protein